jgi:hypothetical protein
MSVHNGDDPLAKPPSRFAKLKKFVKEHDVEIGFAATVGVSVFAVTRAYYTGVIEDLQFSNLVCQEDLADTIEEANLLMDFIDLKKLREKYLEFAEANVAAVEEQIKQRISEQTNL